MTNIDNIFRDFGRFYVGSEELLDRLNRIHDGALKSPNYPPYNIKKTGETTYQIELALAGFRKEDIDIELKEQLLSISGNNEDIAEDYIHKGIANRSFNRVFTLSDDIVVNNADLVNGMLIVYMERIIPEHKKPRKISLNSIDEKKLLVE